MVLKGENAKVHARDEIKLKEVDGGKTEVQYVADINLRARLSSPPGSWLPMRFVRSVVSYALPFFFFKCSGVSGS